MAADSDSCVAALAAQVATVALLSLGLTLTTSAQIPGSTGPPPQKTPQSAAGAPRSGSTAKPLTEQQIQGLVAGGVDSRRLALLVDSRGIDFVPSSQFLNSLKASGVDDVLIQALMNARPAGEGSKSVSGGPPAAPAASLPAQPVLGAAGLASPSGGGSSKLSPALERGLEQDMARAAEFNRLQSWTQAEDIYRSALRVDPGLPAAHVGLATALAGEKRWDDAITEYREVLQLDPKNQIAHRELARAFAEKRDWDDAVVEYAAALRLEPNDGALQARYGDALYAKGDLNHAIAAYQAAQKLKPGDAAIERALGLALYTSGDVDGALTAFREAARLDPTDPEVHRSIGDVLLNRGDRLGALEEYHRAFELAPDDSTMGASYAAILKKLGTASGPAGSAKSAKGPVGP
jgi:tetratricopeptide (TPR) repeat protein